MAKDKKKALEDTVQSLTAKKDKLKESKVTTALDEKLKTGKEKVGKKIQENKEKLKVEIETRVSGESPAPSKIVKAKRSKFKCATTGKHFCDQCGKGIESGETLRMVDVKYADKHADQFKFCSKACRNAYCDANGIPQ